MKFLSRFLCNVLIITMAWVPFAAQSALVSTGQVIASNQANDVDKVQEFISRAEVQAQLEAVGVDAALARERVAAMTQEEINRMAGNIDTLPAGATDSWVWWTLGIIVVGGVLWYLYK